jgi:hypothetical protein
MAKSGAELVPDWHIVSLLAEQGNTRFPMSSVPEDLDFVNLVPESWGFMSLVPEDLDFVNLVPVQCQKSWTL